MELAALILEFTEQVFIYGVVAVVAFFILRDRRDKK